MLKKITVKANSNIALIKYWGKRDEKLFLPTKSSLSITLSGLSTITSISLARKNECFLNGLKITEDSEKKFFSFLSLFKSLYGIKENFRIDSRNTFPTSAGLASSASGFAALAYALAEICELKILLKEVSILARRGSGSACRSVFGGFVFWQKGKRKDGLDSHAKEIFTAKHWPEFRVLVTVVEEKKKKVSSRKAMSETVKTSPEYWQWVKESNKRLPLMLKAIERKNFSELGNLAEADCLGMHQVMQKSKPSINYLKPKTMEIIEFVRKLRRKEKINCYFTIDAGPNVKILCEQENVDFLAEKIKKEIKPKNILSCCLGSEPEIIQK